VLVDAADLLGRGRAGQRGRNERERDERGKAHRTSSRGAARAALPRSPRDAIADDAGLGDDRSSENKAGAGARQRRGRGRGNGGREEESLRGGPPASNPFLYPVAKCLACERDPSPRSPSRTLRTPLFGAFSRARLPSAAGPSFSRSPPRDPAS